MTLGRQLVAEGLGSLLLAAAVIGSGIMAERLAGGNTAIALLANTAATVAALGALITLLAPVSGAHFNPAVTFAAVVRRDLSPGRAGTYVLAQVAGCCAGAMLAHLMFDEPLLQTSTQLRSGVGQWVAEFVATFGLVLIVLGVARERGAAWTIAAWIGAAYWFTASTSFANPAITVARSLTDSFSGIDPSGVPAFVLAQLAGSLTAVGVARLLRTG